MGWDPQEEAFWRQQPLGQMYDTTLGKRVGRHKSTVRKWRVRFGIPAYQPPGRDGVPTEGAGVPSPADPAAPIFEESAVQKTALAETPPLGPSADDTFTKLSKFCRKTERTLDEVCDYLNCGPTNAQQTIAAAQAAGHPLQLQGGRLIWHMPDEWAEDEAVSQTIQPGRGWTQIAFVSDTHFGSKWERSDLLADFFREAYGRGCRLFFHSGDMLDGEYQHSLRERHAPGFDEQAAVAYERLPRGDGAYWHIIDGNHDETISKAGGAVCGRALTERFRSLGRDDVTFHGQRLGRIRLKHEGFDYMPAVELWHPKRGKAYADSYGLQKRIEAYQPGSKPDILAVGHWHAYCHLAKRGVHAMAVPCFQGGGSAFGNSLPGAAVLGGIILNYSLTKHGTLRRVCTELVQYFEREEPRVVETAS